ncbi:hypothetical protein V7S43_006787 [Phytophthora oleae]|uniref:Uncharacterized protein n=1 Tax=Phytophthora oleae TaxID=2107226 RepID=A0ABD3FSF1_9STRA
MAVLRASEHVPSSSRRHSTSPQSLLAAQMRASFRLSRIAVLGCNYSNFAAAGLAGVVAVCPLGYDVELGILWKPLDAFQQRFDGGRVSLKLGIAVKLTDAEELSGKPPLN